MTKDIYLLEVKYSVWRPISRPPHRPTQTCRQVELMISGGSLDGYWRARTRAPAEVRVVNYKVRFIR